MDSSKVDFLRQVGILVADPDPESRRLLTELLQDRVQRFHAVSSAQEAVLAFSRFMPDISLCEVSLPDANGLELARNLLELDPETMVLLLSDPENLPPLQEAFAAGITRHAAKPVDPHRLLPLLERCAGRVLRLKGLETEHRRNALLLESLPTPSMLLAQDTATVVTANPAARDLGFSPGRVCSGEFFPEVVLEAFFPFAREGRRMVLPRTDSMQLDIHAKKRFWEVVYAPIAANTLLFSAIDVTQRVRAQKELKDSSEFLNQVVNTAQAPLSVKDRELRFVTVNEAFCNLLGLAGKDIIGRRIDELIAPHEAEPILEQERKAMASGQANTSEHAITDASGEKHVLIVKRAVFRDPSSQEQVMVSAISDITAQRQMEALREDVERITRHDLKSPLSAVISMPQLILEEGELSETQQEFLHMIHDAGQRILDMVNRSLDIYKMERGVYELQPGPVDLRKVAGRVVQDLKHQAMKALVEVNLQQIPQQQAPCVARGEEMLCYSLLANLLRNAIEACRQGAAVTVQLGSDSQGCLVSIHNPQAVPPEIRDKFFQKYVTHGKQQGTGLGTYSARLMAQTMRGSLDMETHEATGTTLRLRLPPWQ